MSQKYLDPAIEHYERGLKPLFAGKWEEAKKLFDKVIEQSEENGLTERARSMARVCEVRLRPDPADLDPYLQAVGEHNRGAFERALALATEAGRATKDTRFAYLAGAASSALGRNGDALAHLRRAVELEPRARIQAFHDSDFAALHDHTDFLAFFD